jgi:polyferredoxin
MTIQLLLTLVTATVLALLVVRFGAITWAEGAAIGLVAGIGLVATSLASDYLFCGWSLRLYSIQVAYKLVSLTLMGAILGAWR